MSAVIRQFKRAPIRLTAIGLLLIEFALLAIITLWQIDNMASVAIAVFDIDQSAGPDLGVNLREVATHASVMYGRTVTVSAEVHDVRDPHVMVIGTTTPILGKTVLIVSPVGWSTLIREPLEGENVVRVTGEVRAFDPVVLSSELGITLDTSGLANFQDEPVLIVEEIELNPPLAIGPGDKEFPSGSDGWDLIVTIDEVLARPLNYEDQRITVSGEIEEGLLIPHAFLMGDGKLLVLSADPRSDIFVEATAYATGSVRIFQLAEIEAELGVDLDDERFAFFEGSPVLIAESIEIIA